MLENDCYHIRFGPEKEKVDAIWRETEIAKRFEEVIEENKELISNQMSTIRKGEQLKACMLTDDDFTLRFIQNTKFRILWLAMNAVFDGDFDVKQNILEILNSDVRLQGILRERVESTLEIVKREKEYELKEKEYRNRFSEN